METTAEQTREEIIEDFKQFLEEHKKEWEASVIKPEDMSDEEWEDWEG